MILADKIIEERKKLGLSQEELAEKLNVSRQAVSKWEGAQSIPDLQRIVAMSGIFSVSTDYLLKDEIEPESSSVCESVQDRTVRRVSMEEANEYLESMKRYSKAVSLGVALCIFSSVFLLFFVGLSEGYTLGITEKIALVIGLSALFLSIAAAVFLFIRSGVETEGFEYLEKEEFETEYGVDGVVKEKKLAYGPVYTKCLSLGIVLCVLSPLPLIISAVVVESDSVCILMAALLLCFVTAGVYLIVRTGIVQTSFYVLLQEGNYEKNGKRKNAAEKAARGIY